MALNIPPIQPTNYGVRDQHIIRPASRRTAGIGYQNGGRQNGSHQSGSRGSHQNGSRGTYQNGSRQNGSYQNGHNQNGGLRVNQPVKPQPEWATWDELPVFVRGISVDETTYSLWRNFSTQGNIRFIEIGETYGKRNSTAIIKFSPPPDKAFWENNNGSYRMLSANEQNEYHAAVFLDHRRARRLQIPSPIRKTVKYDPRMKMYAESICVGLLIDNESMMSLHTLMPAKEHDLCFCVDLIRNRIIATFSVYITDPGPTATESRDVEPNVYDRINKYRFEIPFGQLKTIQQLDIDQRSFGLVMSLESPPLYYRKRVDEKAGHSDEKVEWNEFDTWYRQTDIVYDPYKLQTSEVALHKEMPIIDIGRWTTYHFKFDKSKCGLYNTIKQALEDFNIKISSIANLRRAPAHTPELWSLLDSPTSGEASAELSFLSSGISLPFEVRYQLEVCISRGVINEYNFSAAFVKELAKLASHNPTQARNILEYVAGQEKRIYEPMAIFSDNDALAYTSRTDIPHYCAYSRKATITPTTLYFSSPTVETTNRVLRRYAQENRDGRFLRVQFTDELLEGRINACADKQRNDELFSRVYRTLYNGIRIGDRHYEFLAFGNAQFRENGAYFFCPTEHLSCNDIRQWMGNFSHIPVVAKYAARLGQCFSTTRAINGLSAPDIVKIPDVERGEYCFTDGVGKISPFLAQMIAAELGVRAPAPPSCFQFRLGGCKGILTVWPDAKDKQVHIRKSQQKFTAVYNGLEIIRCSRFSLATLNRQTITILSSLGVPDKVFLDMMSEQLAKYQSAMSNDDEAVNMLLRFIDDNQMTINIATMIRNGFMAKRDPFVLSLLHLWRSWSIKLLKEKARILVENGAFVLGCVDETGTLRGYSKPTVAYGEELAEEDLPQIFIQVPDKLDPTKYNVIEGICLVGRNPSLHPGDLRVVQAVNVPALHHLRDVVVFPLNGERDVPSMCSGGDLDGDDFFVIWDEKLRPPEWNCDPMNYTAPKPRELGRPVEIMDLMKFFVRYMKNDSLPTIAHAHLAQADFQFLSVKDPKCLELAALHSKAVDYVKTGEPAQMPKNLAPSKWPHFMEKKFKTEKQKYRSNRILGQLYDKVETVDFVPQWQEPFDRRILQAYKLDDSILKSARQLKSQYDTAMKRLMAQQEIRTEFEIWTTFVLSKPRIGTDYKLQEELGRLTDGLKDQFRAACIDRAGGKEFAVLGPFVAAMYKVTKVELDIALAECRDVRVTERGDFPKRTMEPKYMPLISFPWLFEKELGRIATGTDISDDLDEPGLATLAHAPPSKKRHGGKLIDFDDFITQEDGIIVHRGEELDLFREGDDSDEFGEYDLEEARYDGDDHLLVQGRSGETVLATEFDMSNPTPEHLRGGTGVEDVIPRTLLEGLVDPRRAAKIAHESQAKFNNGQLVPDLPAPLNDSSKPKPDPQKVLGAFSGSKAKDSHLQDLALLVADKPVVDSIDDGVEEVIDLEVKDSALEKLDSHSQGLARLVDIDSVADGVDEGVEEVVDFEVKSSALEKLACVIDGEDGADGGVEEVVDFEAKDSALEKLAHTVDGADDGIKQVVDFEVKNSSLEKLACVIDGEDGADGGVEEVVDFEVTSSAVEKLARAIDESEDSVREVVDLEVKDSPSEKLPPAIDDWAWYIGEEEEEEDEYEALRRLLLD